MAASLNASASDLVVSTITAQPSASYGSSRVYAGQTVASRASQLGFKRGGEIDQIHVDLGQRVEAGAPLARLDQQSLLANLRQAEADVELALANVKALEAQTRLALNTSRRIEELHGRGHVSEQGLDEAKLTAVARAAELNVAKANLQRSRAIRDAAQVAVDESVITAPFAGIIQNRYVDEGAQVQSAQPVLRLIEDGIAEAHVGLPDHTVASLTQQNRHRLKLGNRQINGTLVGVLPEVDATSRTQTAVFRIEEDVIPIGAVVELILQDQVSGNGFWLPVSSLIARDRGLWGVYVVNTDSLIERRLVEIIHTEAERAFVRGTLNQGDRVVDTGVQRLVPGQKVVVELIADRT